MNALGWGPRGGRRSASPAVAPIRAEAWRGSDAMRRPDVQGVTGHLEIELVFGGGRVARRPAITREGAGAPTAAPSVVHAEPATGPFGRFRRLRLTRIRDCVHARHGLLFHATLPAGPGLEGPPLGLPRLRGACHRVHWRIVRLEALRLGGPGAVEGDGSHTCYPAPAMSAASGLPRLDRTQPLTLGSRSSAPPLIGSRRTCQRPLRS